MLGKDLYSCPSLSLQCFFLLSLYIWWTPRNLVFELGQIKTHLVAASIIFLKGIWKYRLKIFFLCSLSMNPFLNIVFFLKHQKSIWNFQKLVVIIKYKWKSQHWLIVTRALNPSPPGKALPLCNFYNFLLSRYLQLLYSHTIFIKITQFVNCRELHSAAL